MLEAFFLTWLGVFMAQASPGPNLLATASVALGDGRRAGLFVVTGISSGMLIWSLSTAFGLGVLLSAFPVSLILMKLVGGGYLLLLGIKAARSVVSGKRALIAADKRAITAGAAWRRGLLVVLTNPKAALMWAAVATFLFGQGLSPAEVLLFGPIGALSGLVVYGAYAWLFSTDIATRTYAGFARWIEAAFAATFGAMGAALLWSGLREVR